MFFKKKYLFPIEDEKKRYPIKGFLFTALSVYSFFLIFNLYLLRISDDYSKRTTDTFFNHSPDLIVVPTGDFGRIALAIEKAKKYSISNIFITGVYKKNSIENIIPQDIPEDINVNFFEIDYIANNTVENAVLTLRHLRHNPEIKNILVISSDYHLPRVKMIFDQLKSTEDTFELYYFGKETNFSSLSAIKKIHFEGIKYIRNFLMLLFWDPKIEEI